MRYIEIKLTKYTLFLTERELQHLLSMNPELWVVAIRRGKHILRARASEARQARSPKHISEILPGALRKIERQARKGGDGMNFGRDP